MTYAPSYDAERMLDRHGIAYICAHPEILLGRPPSIDAVDRAYACFPGEADHSLDFYPRTAPRYRLASRDNLLMVSAHQNHS